MKKIYTFLVFIILISGCTIYSKLPQITHVIGIAENGDTIRIPISELKPSYIYNHNHFPNTYNRYYPYLTHIYYPYDYNYNRWNHTVHYNRSVGKNNINTNSSSIATRKHTSNSVSKKAKIQ